MTLTGILVNRLSSAGTQFLNDDDGAALAEYGILVAFIAIVAIVAVTFFGSKVSAKFSEYATKV
ncbi:MAG: Flp family type IVb pilin [Gemmatimonadaceae bacterium]|nr:Flp family type IVb pilin [Gemmatimonadaceae bacterium]